MKHKTSELTGDQLDAAVAKALGFRPGFKDDFSGGASGPVWIHADGLLRSVMRSEFHPSTDWAYGGPIIERERIDIGPKTQIWTAHCGRGFGIGPTPLIAAMRAYVASKLGEEVDL